MLTISPINTINHTGHLRRATGNAIAIGGTNFKRVWSGIFKGAENKQYAAQISFVMNPNEACLDVGFYFGRASGHSFDK